MVALALLALLLGQNKPVLTAKNWRHHPEIEAIRWVVREVALARKSGGVKDRHRYFPAGCHELERVLGVDGTGRSRYLKLVSRTEDITATAEAYYDGKSRLRFVLLRQRADQSPRAEPPVGLYYDESGNRIWSEGPLIRIPEGDDAWRADAEERYSAASPCDGKGSE
jgi:hypothetical protein